MLATSRRFKTNVSLLCPFLLVQVETEVYLLSWWRRSTDGDDLKVPDARVIHRKSTPSRLNLLLVLRWTRRVLLYDAARQM